ncbi:lysosomal acid phosphatase [Cephus cinctus]|uniref:Lysosomal acid phosphatase n=1 Tax=Cephus cinctus TaxID=211228 RepID=A0AAJ7FK91_CEPCN|nr:lysosomal acid phosphatase [Cephus cinctus]
MGSFKLIKLIFLLAILRTNLGGKTFFEMLQKATKHSGFLREYESDIECIKDTLRLVTVVFRHGQRTPADTYPTDPHINDSMVPYGWGQLTNEGKLNQYNQGLYLRKRYGKLLGTVYSPDIFYLRSTEVDRTKMSAMLEAAALWRPEQNQIFKEDLPWQPVILHYEPKDKDNLLLTTPCPAYFQELDRVMKSAEIIKLQEENELMYQELRNFTGLNIRNPDDIWSLYGTLRAEPRDKTRTILAHLTIEERNIAFRVGPSDS